MKRSEMVKLMWDYIQTVETDYDEYMFEHNADELLNKMEEAGMLPPLLNEDARTETEAIYEWDKE